VFEKNKFEKKRGGRKRSHFWREGGSISIENLTLFQIFPEAEGAEDRGGDSKDKEGKNMRPEHIDSVSF